MTLAVGSSSAPAAAAETEPRDPAARLAGLLDAGSVEPLHRPDDSGMYAVHGRIDGASVVAYCSDAARMGGAIGMEGCRHVVGAIETAVREHCPVLGVWHSGGARLAEGVQSLDGMGRMFVAMIRASGRVPQISVVVGPAAGGAAYGPALTDLIVIAPAGKMFVTGPEVVRAVTGEEIDMDGLGGALAHSRHSGVVHVVAADEAGAYARARLLTGRFTRPGSFDLTSLRDEADPRALLPDRASVAYDVKRLVRVLLDDGSFEELQASWAPNIVIGLGRLAGRAVGVIANNPLRKAGCLDSLSAEKAARFVRMCDAFGTPLIVLVDVPGYLPGVGQEWGGVVRRGAKLLHAFGEAVVPRVTLVTRKSYGGAYIAMNSRSLGATAVFAWQGAEVAIMDAKAAVGVLHRKKLDAAPDDERDGLRTGLAQEHERIAGGLDRAVAVGVVDEVIDPRHTRRKLAEALAAAPSDRGAHTNIPL
jgi:acetyl-CoA/propionyl-CoA carboxylase carboxyl transferase subunit